MTGLIAQRINQIRQQIPSRVRLVAVTKQVSVEAIREAYGAGIRDFAENRIQEALPKQKQLEDLPDICWHFIGHLQANKAQKALEHFEWIHSVDSLKLARRLDRLADSLPSKPKVCLQVKILSDPKKYGFSVSELLAALSELERCDRLNIRGLMTILPLGLSRSETLAAFQATRSLAEKITQQNLSNLVFEELSMGMSADYLLAIEAGATIIRLGRIIFGERQGKI